jgi:hypothetical protein
MIHGILLQPGAGDLVPMWYLTQEDVPYHTIYLLVFKIYILERIIEVLSIVVPTKCNRLNSVLRYIYIYIYIHYKGPCFYCSGF